LLAIKEELENLTKRDIPIIPSFNTQKDYGAAKKEGKALLRKGFFLMLFFLVPVGIRYILKGKALLADDVYTALSKDKRKPVVYLRSFSTDKIKSNSAADNVGSVVSGLLYNPSIEIKIAQGINNYFSKRYGPYISIAKPNEFPPPLGFSKCYVDNENWKRVIIWMLECSQLTVVRVGKSDGLFWELVAVFNLCKIDRIMLIFDPTSISSSKLNQSYEEISILLSNNFDIIFPKENKGRRIITFSDSRNAILHSAGILKTIITGNSFGMSIRTAANTISET